jgi:hypothetical protein
MLSDSHFSSWVIGVAGCIAGLAAIGLFVSWRRARSANIALPRTITIQPLKASRNSKLGNSSLLLLSPLAARPVDSDAENRAAFRRVGNAVPILVAEMGSQRAPVEAWVIDRSRRGLRLALNQGLPVGSRFSVRPAQAPPTMSWCAVEVRHCSDARDHWEVGCRFLETPPVKVLMQFG